MTRLALNLSDYVNGVAEPPCRDHRRACSRAIKIRAITNGVHAADLDASIAFAVLFDRPLPAWAHEPEMLVAARPAARRRHLGAPTRRPSASSSRRSRERTGVELRPDVAAHRLRPAHDGYKRPDLLFTDLDRLLRIHARASVPGGDGRQGPSARRASGKQLIRTHPRPYRASSRHRSRSPSCPTTTWSSPPSLVSGADVWLNTPLPPLEASGTSGMKAAFNGVLNLSVLDGWWVEGCIEGVTGWAIGRTASPAPSRPTPQDLYQQARERGAAALLRRPRRAGSG